MLFRRLHNLEGTTLREQGQVGVAHFENAVGCNDIQDPQLVVDHDAFNEIREARDFDPGR
jgi:hypothetical protein